MSFILYNNQINPYEREVKKGIGPPKNRTYENKDLHISVMIKYDNTSYKYP